jgi:hypothetical protein
MKPARSAPSPHRARGDRTARRKTIGSRKPRTFDEYWAALRQSGWIADVPEADSESVRQRLARAFEVDPDTTYLALADTSFDAEMIEDVGASSPLSYTSLVRQLARHSRGAFGPTAIREQRTADGASIRLSFAHGAKRFSATIPVDDDWVRPELFDLVNRALADAGQDRRLTIFPPVDGQTVYVAYVSEGVWQRAERLGLVPALE